MAGTDSSHGVWQRPPLEARASAPGGLDSIVSVAVDSGSNRSMFGMPKFGMFEFAEQLASPRPHSAATIPRQIFTPAPFDTRAKPGLNDVNPGTVADP